MLGWLTSRLRSGNSRGTQLAVRERAELELLRRWEAANTNRLNRAQWQQAAQLSPGAINDDLAAKLPTLWNRCNFEATNNPLVEGVIETHQTDLIGPEGPSLQIQSDNESYNRAREQVWQEWFECPDHNGVMSGAETMRLWVGMLWKCGEYLYQITTQRLASGPVKMRILDLHPSRLWSPIDKVSDSAVVMGIRRTREGRPTQYYIADLDQAGTAPTFFGYYPVSPDLVGHVFKVFEPGQARGFPWLSSSVQSVMDMRDYDAQVLDAARAAADKELLLYTEHDDAPFLNMNGATRLERRTLQFAPPGWKPWQGQASQPAAQYIDYRKERQREIGRPVGMPLMRVRSGSEDHNYSAARYDGKVYTTTLGPTRTMIAKRSLNPLESEVAREAELAGAIPPRPRRVKQVWTWADPPEVDPEKQWQGFELAVAMGGMDLSDVAAKMGTDLETLVAKRVRTMELLKRAGLPPAPYWTPRGGAQPAEAETDPDTGLPLNSGEKKKAEREEQRPAPPAAQPQAPA